MQHEMKCEEVLKLDIPVMPEKYQFAMAYVPFQKYERILTPEEALQKGSIFPELVNIPIYRNY